MMDKACKLAKQIVDLIETHQDKYVNDSGKDIASEYYIESLNDIVQKIFVLYAYVSEKKLCLDNPDIASSLQLLAKLGESLTINKDNAEKLTISSAIELWNKVKITGALLACTLLDIQEQGK